MSEYVIANTKGQRLELQLHRPRRKNALNLAMYKALKTHLADASTDDSIRVVLLSGVAGCFTSGNDLGDFTGVDLQHADNPILQFMETLAAFPKPVVVAVDGMAVGIGTTLLLHCDFVYASAAASFALPFVNLGLCPEYACSLLLPRLAGHVKACEWLLLGEAFSAHEALAAGLVNGLADNPLDLARDTCAKLVKQPPVALRQAKALLKRASSAQVEQAIAAEVEAFGHALKGAEFAEAAAAFFDKRPADFSKC